MNPRAEIGSWSMSIGATLAFVGVVLGVVVALPAMWNESWSSDATLYASLAVAALAGGVLLYLVGEHMESTPPPFPEREEKERPRG